MSSTALHEVLCSNQLQQPLQQGCRQLAVCAKCSAILPLDAGLAAPLVFLAEAAGPVGPVVPVVPTAP